MELILWHKDAKPSSYYATQDGKRIPTARKEGTSWTGTVVGLGFSFGGRRRGDVKELAQHHGERFYGSGEWILFPARDLKPGMVVGRDTRKEGRGPGIRLGRGGTSPTASEDLALSEGGASLHDSSHADALHRPLRHGVETLEGEDCGMSLEGVTADGRQVLSLYVSDSITTEPDFEKFAMSIEALREAAGLDRLPA